MSLTIAQMKLSPNARKGAEWVQVRHPEIVFTSGRRDAKDQARVMAQNVAKFGSGWLFATYKMTPILKQLNDWVEENSTVKEPQLIADGFYECLLACRSDQLSALSRHLTGDAWDAAWPGDEKGEQIVRDIQINMPVEFGLHKVIDREGGLRIIHAQFAPSTEI